MMNETSRKGCLFLWEKMYFCENLFRSQTILLSEVRCQISDSHGLLTTNYRLWTIDYRL